MGGLSASDSGSQADGRGAEQGRAEQSNVAWISSTSLDTVTVDGGGARRLRRHGGGRAEGSRQGGVKPREFVGTHELRALWEASGTGGERPPRVSAPSRREALGEGGGRPSRVPSPSSCRTVCGDGFMKGAEECDDGNDEPGDGKLN